MSRRYAEETPAQTDGDVGPAIIGQVPGPRSWSEYWDGPGNEFDPADNFHRNNATPLDDGIVSLSDLRARRGPRVSPK